MGRLTLSEEQRLGRSEGTTPRVGRTHLISAYANAGTITSGDPRIGGHPALFKTKLIMPEWTTGVSERRRVADLPRPTSDI